MICDVYFNEFSLIYYFIINDVRDFSDFIVINDVLFFIILVIIIINDVISVNYANGVNDDANYGANCVINVINDVISVINDVNVDDFLCVNDHINDFIFNDIFTFYVVNIFYTYNPSNVLFFNIIFIYIFNDTFFFF